ncbi:MAG: outer membrane lipoprotein-sorting protein [Myxococcota bacterium]
MSARALGLLLLVPIALQGAWAEDVETKRDASTMTAQEISQCVQQNFPDDTMKQTVQMVMTDRMGVERLLEAEMFWQKDQQTRLSKVRLDFDNPPELRGAAILVIEKEPKNDMFMFLPELGKTRRITSSMVNGNMMGTDFTYEDFARLQGMLGNMNTERLPDQELAGRPAFVTSSTPGGDSDSEYERIHSVIDQATCVSLQVEFFEKGHEGPVKRMTVDPTQLQEVATGWFPNAIRMEDLRGGTSTALVIEKLEVSVKIHRKRFTQTDLEKQGRFGPAVKQF